jgi:RNA polymerase sigma factor for flagellar operon FliA
MRAIETGFIRFQDRDDAIAEAHIGLLRAAALYVSGHPSGASFRTFAIHTIRARLLEWQRGESWVPRSIKEKRKALNKRAAAGEAISQREWDQVRLYIRVSIDSLPKRRVDGEPQGVPADPEKDETAIDPAEAAINTAQQDALLQALARIPERERSVLTRYYWERRTFLEIGAEDGISASRTYQLAVQGRARLRQHLESQGWNETTLPALLTA